jgi:phage baseplate assembly protein W|tara:strand:- start:452 stop:853 length:402 start_codon:yes stop_codon:yes gene_type:complete
MATPLTQRVVYSDFFTDLDKHPIRSTVLRKTNVDAVKQSLRNLMLTDKGERLFQPNLGGNIRAMLFENITAQTFLTMQEHIKDVIAAHEPRADVIDVYIAQTSQEHEVQITIVFRVVNVQEPVTLELLLERVR